MLATSSALVARGHRVDIVVCRAEGALLGQIPEGVRAFELQPAPTWLSRACTLAAEPPRLNSLRTSIFLVLKLPNRLPYLPSLVRYLRDEQPEALFAAGMGANLAAVWARGLAPSSARVVVSQRNTLSSVMKGWTWKCRSFPPLVRRNYLAADAIIAVSEGVAEDLVSVTGIPRDRITTVHNPVVTPDLEARAREPLDHPWLVAGAPPLVLGAGRLVPQKDFPTLVRAFARVRAVRDAKLMILGEGKDAQDTARRRAELMALAAELGIADDVDLPGFAPNPFAYMARASVFVLSSAWEGFGNVLVEALACGCPVVSTDCPSGPREILDDGRYGRLVPVGDDAALAGAVLAILDAPADPERLRDRAMTFSVDRALDRYLELLLGAAQPGTDAQMTRPVS